MTRFPGKKPYHLEFYSRQAGEIRSLLHALEMQEGFEETENRPRMDMYETEDKFVLEFDLPGFQLENISLKLRGVTLMLEAYRPPEQSEGRFICLERGYGNFRYIVEIPGDTNPCSVTAEYRLGVLRVTCPKGDDIQVPIKEITP